MRGVAAVESVHKGAHELLLEERHEATDCSATGGVAREDALVREDVGEEFEDDERLVDDGALGRGFFGGALRPSV